MLDLPWYAWLNLIGLVSLWGIYWISHNADKTHAAVRVANYMVLMTAAFFIINNNENLAGNTGLPLKGLAVFLMVMTLWELASSIYVLWIRHDYAIAPNADLPRRSGGEHLFGHEKSDVSPSKNQEKIAKAMGNLVSNDVNASQRLQSLGTLLTLEEETDQDNEDATLHGLLGVALVALVLVPPCYIATAVF